MMSWQTIKERIAESAIDFALNAFWVAVCGLILTAAAGIIARVRGAPAWVFVAAMSAACTLLAVVLITSAVVALKHRSLRHSGAVGVGQKGFLDYKIQASRAVNRLSGNLGTMTAEMERVGRETSADAARLVRAQQRGGDERGYRAMTKAAHHLLKRAAKMKLHAIKYAKDVDLMIEGTTKWMEWLLETGTADPRELQQFASALRGFKSSMNFSLAAMQEFRAIVDQNRRISERFDVAGAAMSEAVSIVIDATRKASDFSTAQIQRLSG